MYTSATHAKDATEYRNLINALSVQKYLPVPLAEIVGKYSFIDPHIPEFIYSNPHIDRTRTIRHNSEDWTLRLYSSGRSFSIDVECKSYFPYKSPWGYTVEYDKFCIFLLDGKKYPISAYDEGVKIINESHDWIYGVITAQLPNPQKIDFLVPFIHFSN